MRYKRKTKEELKSLVNQGFVFSLVDAYNDACEEIERLEGIMDDEGLKWK
jgi:hypothetical protein